MSTEVVKKLIAIGNLGPNRTTPLWKSRGSYLVSKVVPHLRGKRGECPVIPLNHWKGVALPRYRSLRQDLSKYTVPTSFAGMSIPTTVVGMLEV